ncbi:MAG: transcription antitermination factor NusB [Saprospiraceae bacterium]|nr:transcription antitermination factor NusB [Saprospiraceae bacterium]
MAPETSPEQLLQEYTLSCQKSYKLLLYTLNNFLKLANFALKEEELRATKLLSTEDDALYTPILYTNPLTQSLVRNKFLLNELSQQKIGEIKDEDILRQVYSEFSKSEEYLAYWKENKDHQAILLKLLKVSIANPLFEELLDDYSPAWVDDKSLIIGTLKKIIKALPLDGPFYEEYQPDKELVEEFGRNMLLRVWNRNEDLTESIGPTLKNWDVNRVATLDMIMLKMAVCEFMYFPTIPPKVTLNEFVEIAKQYSTDKSKEFVNGILDRLMKDLMDAGKINKAGRGLVE